MAFCISEDFSLAELGISVLQFWVVLYYNKQAGADVTKIVVIPHSEEDVLTFLGCILAFRRAHPEYPIIASGGGPVGAVTRLIGGLFGIDLTFAVGSKASGPGQMPVDAVRQCLEVIYPK